jgi:four helix bundle protein
MPFEAYDHSFEFIRRLRRIADLLATRHPDLVRQIRRAVTSVALNLGEGAGRTGKNRRHHYRIALGSAREVEAGLRCAEAWGDLQAEELEPVYRALDRLLALLWGLTR